MTEAELQHTVRTVAELCGWRVMHVRRSIGKGNRWTTSTSVVGWPDLFMYHPRKGRLLACELKVPPGRLTREQHVVLGELADAGAEVAVLVPDDVRELGALLAPDGPRLTRTRVRTIVLPAGKVEL